MKVFCISGLGADHRSFSRLDLPGHELVAVPWIEHKPNETLPEYALRLANTIDRSEPFALLGLSFGGMLAVEMASVIQPRKLILLSSVSSPNEMPQLYRLAGQLHLTRLIPNKMMLSPNPLAHWSMSVKRPEDRDLFDEILRDTDPEFAKWAVNAISTWQKTSDHDCHRIHGDKDNVLPCPVNCSKITGAGHLAVFTHAPDVSEALARILDFE